MKKMKKYTPLFVVPSWMLFSIIAAILIMGSATANAEEVKQDSIYCDDGSLCVPEGEPEPECD
jgi:hypothetical protein